MYATGFPASIHWNNSLFHYSPQRLKAADPKKASPAPAAAAEAGQAAKAKEEPKAAAKASEAAVDSKPAAAASQAADDAASVPKKLEKRNSVQLILKFLVRRAFYSPAPLFGLAFILKALGITTCCSFISTRWQQQLIK